MNSFWETLDSLGGVVGGVLSSQYNAKAANANATTAAALAKTQAAQAAQTSQSATWTKYALIGGGALAVLAIVYLAFRK